jgi:hypothetical protein
MVAENYFPRRGESARGLAHFKKLARSSVAREWREASWSAVALHRFFPGALEQF